MICVQDLTKRFGRVQVLNGVSLDIEEPGIYAVLGPNGSGKTTILKTILGMVLPDSGTVTLNGKDLTRNHLARNQIGYLPQIANFPENLRVRELISMIEDIRGMDGNYQELIADFHLKSYLNKRLGNLSGGTRQKVNILLMFMFDSPILVLDEPTAGLDPSSMVVLKKLIQEEKKKGKHIIITTHIMSLVEELADYIIFLLDGKIFFNGTIDTIQSMTNQRDLEHAVAKITADV